MTTRLSLEILRQLVSAATAPFKDIADKAYAEWTAIDEAVRRIGERLNSPIAGEDTPASLAQMQADDPMQRLKRSAARQVYDRAVEVLKKEEGKATEKIVQQWLDQLKARHNKIPEQYARYTKLCQQIIDLNTEWMEYDHDLADFKKFAPEAAEGLQSTVELLITPAIPDRIEEHEVEVQVSDGTHDIDLYGRVRPGTNYKTVKRLQQTTIPGRSRIVPSALYEIFVAPSAMPGQPNHRTPNTRRRHQLVANDPKLFVVDLDRAKATIPQWQTARYYRSAALEKLRTTSNERQCDRTWRQEPTGQRLKALRRQSRSQRAPDLAEIWALELELLRQQRQLPLHWQLFGKRLAFTRAQLGLTDYEAAIAFHVTLNTYRKWEKGRCHRYPHRVIDFARSFEISIDWLVDGTGPLPHRKLRVYLPNT